MFWATSKHSTDAYGGSCPSKQPSAQRTGTNVLSCAENKTNLGYEESPETASFIFAQISFRKGPIASLLNSGCWNHLVQRPMLAL
mmetsp:Transcript_8764/g.11565  ORF Transcript_8764/g.11565 Transcript_8764/m.11565 type:complete len:85 (+) Transcript_8764:296-550(+)